MSTLAIWAPRLFDGERFVEGGVTVVAEAGVVSAVQPGPPTARDGLDLRTYLDATIIPGLIDSHVHLVGDSDWGALDRVAGYSDQEIDAVVTEALRAQLAAGVTTVRDLGDRRWCSIERRDAQQHSTPGFSEPTILGSGPPITSRGGHCWYLGGEVEGIDEIVMAVSERARRHVDIVKVMASGGMATPGTDVLRTQFSTQELQLLVARAHAAGLSVTAHAHGLPAVRQAVAAGVDQIEHCSCLTETGIEAPQQLLDSIAEKGIVVGGALGYPTRALLERVRSPIKEMMQRAGITFEAVREMRLEHISRLHDAGVTLVAGTDAGISADTVHGVIHRAVEVFAEAGATTEVALSSATAAAARACGLADRKGSIRPGYDADLCVVGGDLRARLTDLTVVTDVFLGGQQARISPTSLTTEFPQ